jgi:cellulose synthase/poly-beta-1,6-N-acetylglucosamine synthase-like glycosyltransferase
MSTTDHIILFVFFAATTVQLFYWLYFFSRLVFYKENSTVQSPQSTVRSHQFPVSVIICAHNEAHNLERHLDRILNQNYRSYEVLVVLHNSSDDSSNVLASLQSQFEQLCVIKCDDGRIGKKHALAKGIEQAKHQVLLLTDADCVPASQDWITGMVAGMDENTRIVLGVAPYNEAPGPLNSFIRFEASYTAMQYLAFALAGFPYMGVGRNLAYRRELYESKGGFRKHGRIASGDDDLFINEVAQKGNVGIRLNPDTFTYSAPKSTWREYYRQKTRHFSTGKFYKLHHKLLLATLAMSHGLHYLGGLLVVLKISIIFALLGYTVRMCIVMALSSVILKRLRQENLWPWIPALDFALVLYYSVFAPAILMNNYTQRWN